MIEVKCDACQNTMRLVDPPEVQELRARLAELKKANDTHMPYCELVHQERNDNVRWNAELRSNLEEVRRERDAQRQCVVVEHECFERERALYKEALSKLAAATEAANVFREVSAGYKAKLDHTLGELYDARAIVIRLIENTRDTPCVTDGLIAHARRFLKEFPTGEVRDE